MTEPRYRPFTGVDFFLPFISHLRASAITRFNAVMLVRGFAPHCVSPQSFYPPAFVIELGCVQQGCCRESLSSVAHINAQPNTPILLLYPAIAKMAGSDDESLLAAQFDYPPCSST
jgi:hypothetical protein